MIKNFPLNTITTVGTGGVAKELIIVKNLSDLIKAISNLKNTNFLIVGGGSNLIFADEGFEGTIIKNEIVGIENKNNTITVQSGTPLQELVNYTIENGLEGLHKLTGIPGTVGGAVYGNAGAYGQTISDNLVSVKILKDKKIIKLLKSECKFDYRKSIFKENKDPIIEIEFQLPTNEVEKLKEESEQILKQRLEKYPKDLKCPGSFFMNVPLSDVPYSALSRIPEDKIKNDRVHVGWLLESVGAKGFKVGGVEVADYHANLFVNAENGKSSDFYDIASELANRVRDKYGIILKPEVQLIGMSKSVL